ncbi:mitochondrial calcium uniporter regulator 1 isoform X5 [Colius striatus]|uniref:mitochondrial calcium uniporter regulator 1 isoform X5 n=1 Tax=Colius striatus TaxID=57412 RepID=UPI002B1E12E3|nr:mitochondrial calcium uniporter regulator 1 isoform X5 [Colius striatus]
MARGQAAVSGGRRALLLLLRPRGADVSLPAGAPAASRDGRAPPPARRCLGDWQRPTAARGGEATGRRGGGGVRDRRWGQRDVSISAAFSLQSKGNISLLGNRKLFFDTHALVCLLEENGFTTRQSEVIVSALVKIMNTNLDIIYKDMVTKVQQDEITKVRADNKLNLNLEKSRVKELYSLNERKLLEMRTEIVELHAQQDRALTQTDRKIDTEVADLKTMLESHKLDNIKYLADHIENVTKDVPRNKPYTYRVYLEAYLW